MSDLSSESPSPAMRNLFPVRLAIGLVQGLVLYGLFLSYGSGTWPSNTGYIFAPLLVIAIFVPLVAMQGYGNLGSRSFAKWIAVSTVIIGALALYDVWRAWPEIWAAPRTGIEPNVENLDAVDSIWQPQVLPSVPFLIFLSAALFVAHALVRSSDADGRFFAHYPTHFDVAWVQLIQIVLSLIFINVFWTLLFLGSSLFNLVGLNFIEKLITKAWFIIPVTTLAAAIAIHLTDSSATLVRGARTLVLTLFSWLLPVLALLLAGFLVALAFTGLEPLWATRNATVLLIVSATASLILVNAVYQDGSRECVPPLTLRLIGTLAAILMLPLVILAGYATGLRVGQYGWTADRVVAAAIIFAVAFHAIGYVIAALRPGQWMKTIERWNFAAALVVLAVFVALFSPIADPQRIGVNSQMARLTSGVVKPADFDFVALRWDGGRFGKNALETLAMEGNPEETRMGASKALAMKQRYEGWNRQVTIDAFDRVTVLPDGEFIPESFRSFDWNEAEKYFVSQCTSAPQYCVVLLTDANDDGVAEVIIWASPNREMIIYTQSGGDQWVRLGSWETPKICSSFVTLMEQGRYSLVRPDSAGVRDLEVGGIRYRFQIPFGTADCPE